MSYKTQKVNRRIYLPPLHLGLVLSLLFYLSYLHLCCPWLHESSSIKTNLKTTKLSSQGLNLDIIKKNNNLLQEIVAEEITFSKICEQLLSL